MTDPMVTNELPRVERVEVITSVAWRRYWSIEEKVRIVEETYLPGELHAVAEMNVERPQLDEFATAELAVDRRKTT